KLSEPAWRVNARQPILPALLGRLDRNLLPFRLFLRGGLQIDPYDRAIGNDRRNLGCPDLDRLLHDQLHVFSLWNRLPKNDSTAQRRGLRLLQFAQLNFIAARIDNFSSDFVPESVKENELLPVLRPQDIAGMVRF